MASVHSAHAQRRDRGAVPMHRNRPAVQLAQPQPSMSLKTIVISRVAWIGAAPARMHRLPWQVDCHPDSDGFLLADEPFAYDAYVVALNQIGMLGLELVALLRRRTTVPLVALDDDGLPDLVLALDSGADIVLPLGAGEAAVVAAISAIARRAGAKVESACWGVDMRQPTLRSPGGVALQLSATEHVIMLALAEARGGAVGRDALAAQIWGSDAGPMENPLHAAIYRLRRRIGEACGDTPPIRSVPSVGYAFAAPIKIDG